MFKFNFIQLPIFYFILDKSLIIQLSFLIYYFCFIALISIVHFQFLIFITHFAFISNYFIFVRFTLLIYCFSLFEFSYYIRSKKINFQDMNQGNEAP